VFFQRRQGGRERRIALVLDDAVARPAASRGTPSPSSRMPRKCWPCSRPRVIVMVVARDDAVRDELGESP
jgi:hypothetical protein